jgi:hypothetical protein
VPRFVTRSGAALILSVAAAAAWISPAALAAGSRPAAASPAVSSVTGDLSSVAAISAGNAWAVGVAGSSSLTLHWTGHSWTRVSAPGKGLASVAASSAGNVWAIGDAASGPLILHWTGSSWTRTPAPFPAHANLNGIATSSGSNAWAVGSYLLNNRSDRTLTLHWNGHSWKRVASANPRSGAHTGDLLASVAIASASDVWAVGARTSDFAGEQGGLVLHWNGRSWSQSSAKAITGSASGFTGVVATSPGNVWTAGCTCGGGVDGGVIGHWNGHSWSRQANPVQRKLGAVLFGIGASSRSTGFAAGSYCKSACLTSHPFYTALILRWTGSAWKMAAIPVKRNDTLIGVAAASASSAWAVGDSSTGKVLILHWNGHSWQAAS